MDLDTKKPAKTSCTKSSISTLPQDAWNLIVRARQLTNDRILRQPLVCEKTGRADATLWKDVSEGTFPPPIRIGPRAVGWRESEVNAWLEACSLATRRAGQPFDMKVFIAELTSFKSATNLDDRFASLISSREGGTK